MKAKSGSLVGALLLAHALGGCAASHSDAIFADQGFNLGKYRCVVVVPFENQSRTEGAGFAVADFMANALNTSERFVVVDRKVVQTMLDDPGPNAYTMDPGRAVEMGHKLNADAVVIGAVSDYWYRTLDGKPEVTLSMRVVDVSAERVVYVANGSYQPTFFTRRPYLLTAASKEVADELMTPLTRDVPLRSLDGLACGLSKPAPVRSVAVPPAPRQIVAPPAPKPVVAVVRPPEPKLIPAAPPAPKMPDLVEPPIIEPPVVAVPKPVSAPVSKPVVASLPPPAPPKAALTPGALALLRRMSNTKSFVLEGVDFELDKTAFKGDSYKDALDNLGGAMRDRPGLKVRIESHTDGLGDAQFNLKLTDLRAKLLKDYLVRTFQISPERIESVGYGGERPLLPNINRKNREANRRVELSVLEGP